MARAPRRPARSSRLAAPQFREGRGLGGRAAWLVASRPLAALGRLR